MNTRSKPDFESVEQARAVAKRHRRMADEIAGYPDFEGRDETVRQHRAEAADAYRWARLREQPSKTPRAAAPRTRTATPPSPAPWSASGALRRAGISATRKADKAARKAPGAVSGAVKSSGAMPNIGFGSIGFGGLIVYVFASIILLALLDNALGGKGPAGVSKSLGWLTAAINKLVSPTDPIIARGVLPPPPTVTTKTAASSTSSSTAKTPVAAFPDPQHTP